MASAENLISTSRIWVLSCLSQTLSSVSCSSSGIGLHVQDMCAWVCGYVYMCMNSLLGVRRFMPESHSEVTIHDGTDGGLVMDIHHQRHRGWSLCLIVHFQYDDFFFSVSLCASTLSLSFPDSLSAPRCLSLFLPLPPSLSFFLSVSCFPPSLSPFLTAFFSITLSLSLSPYFCPSLSHILQLRADLWTSEIMTEFILPKTSPPSES